MAAPPKATQFPQPKRLSVVAIAPPPQQQRVQRDAVFAAPGERRTRYSLPERLESCSPVGFRTRISLSAEEAEAGLSLLALSRPTGFGPAGVALTEGELFEETSLGILSSRQSTNFQGHRQFTFGPGDSAELSALLRRLHGLEAPVLDGAAYTHVVFSRPYRTPFTKLLTLIGHKPGLSLATVPLRAVNKLTRHVDDIPTVGYLQHLHVGILADAMDRAAILASGGARRAQVFMAPFAGDKRRSNQATLRALADRCGLSYRARARGWRVALVAQVGAALPGEEASISEATCRKLAANLLAFRSERIQPGVNQEQKAPAVYQQRQAMDVPDELTVMCGRAAYNAFAEWTGVSRERAKDLLLLERIDVLTEGGKERLRGVRRMLGEIADKVVKNLPLWIDLPTGRALSRNAARGKKAFALAGQRIYLAGLSRREVAGAGIDWEMAVRAVGAAAARSALYAELMGTVDIPEGCDLLAGICLMAGPVNQNDIGKTFYGYRDLLGDAFDGRNPTSLLVWTLKAKTVADPIGNEEQLMNVQQKGALVDLRPGPHEVIRVVDGRGSTRPLRDATNQERAFADQGNFVTAPDGREIPGNRGQRWPQSRRDSKVW